MSFAILENLLDDWQGAKTKGVDISHLLSKTLHCKLEKKLQIIFRHQRLTYVIESENHPLDFFIHSTLKNLNNQDSETPEQFI